MDIKIHKTKDYDSFKSILANREIDETHVKNLCESIKRKNLLSVCPVITGDDMEVIDGQHRIEAARQLQTDIYYFKATGLSVDDIIALNNVKKVWTIMDYFNFYVIQKVPCFLKINDLMVRTGFSLQSCMCILHSSGKVITKSIKTGDIDVYNEINVDNLLSAIYDFEKAAPLAYNTVPFIKGLRYLLFKEKKIKVEGDSEYDHYVVSEALSKGLDIRIEKVFKKYQETYGTYYEGMTQLRSDTQYAETILALYNYIIDNDYFGKK